MDMAKGDLGWGKGRHRETPIIINGDRNTPGGVIWGGGVFERDGFTRDGIAGTSLSFPRNSTTTTVVSTHFVPESVRLFSPLMSAILLQEASKVVGVVLSGGPSVGDYRAPSG